jgi:hypothetical protein
MSTTISELFDKSESTFSVNHNYFTKHELKSLFINGYLSKNNSIDFLNQSDININFNNNKSFQCFRNAAFYFLLRMRYTIWITIDDLVDNPYNQGISDIDYNKYLVIQTIIELYNDDIIKKHFPSSDTMSIKRTNFIDARFDELKLSSFDKYVKYGVLTPKNNFERIKQSLLEFGMITSEQNKMNETAFEDSLRQPGNEYANNFYKEYKNQNGGISTDVITEVIANILSKKVSISERITLDTIHEKITNMENIYNYHIINLGSNTNITNFLDIIDNLKNISIKDKDYILVGILYDCPNSIAHQITSICYGEVDCTTNKHLFLDDHSKIIKTLTKTNFNRTNLLWSCGDTGKPFNVSMLLYEKKNIKDLIDIEINSFIKKNINFHEKLSIQFGGYKQKYLKYKNKYIQLKNK